jgi:hypothetical protein
MWRSHENLYSELKRERKIEHERANIQKKTNQPSTTKSTPGYTSNSAIPSANSAFVASGKSPKPDFAERSAEEVHYLPRRSRMRQKIVNGGNSRRIC